MALTPGKGRLAVGGALAAYVVLLFVVVFQPSPDLGDRSIHLLVELAAGVGLRGIITADIAGFALNVVLFMPLTLLASRLVPRWSWLAMTGAGFLASGAIELTQLVLPDRTASLADVAANTLGALLGSLLAARIAGVQRRSPLRRQGHWVHRR